MSRPRYLFSEAQILRLICGGVGVDQDEKGPIEGDPLSLSVGIRQGGVG